MHTGYTYVAADGSSASIYAPPTLDVPDTVTLRTSIGDLKVFERASDRELTCGAVPGVTGAMAVALGEGGVKTVEDLADLATDEIRGGYEMKNGERTKVPGVLESFNLAQEDAEMLILQARVAAGWIDASELPQPPEPEYEEVDYVDEVFGDAPASDASDEGLEEVALENGDAEVFGEDLESSRDA